jgi:hypothetical protein
MLKQLFGRHEMEEREIINTRVEQHVRVVNGALDESEVSSSGIVLNGRIDSATLRFLKVDSSYQRPLGDRSDIFNALKEGKVVPNIEIGVRGQDFVMDGDDFIIRSPAFIIDGWQRVGTSLKLLELIPHHPIRIFGSFHFGTDEIWERHRFTELNKNVKRISPNLHLRNMRDSNEAILTLYGLSMSDRTFPLYKKVSWSQNMGRGELVTALALGLSIYHLHGHRVGLSGRSVEKVSEGLKLAQERVTLATFRRNISTYVSLINECWPFSAIEYRHGATQIKGSFMNELARMLSRHPVFWEHNDNTLVICADDRRKLAKFPMNDPQVMQLAGSTGASRQMLYQLLVDHMNSGRRTQRLRTRQDQ